ncbi:MAG TPA: DUF2905 domain-containing protein [Candidatus Angelobacter sp.]|nr:DUF2905 domain-containing protein [Candidatus Angelobacter sp.]
MIGRILLVLGLLIAAAGLLMTFGVRLPFGRLPGDISGSSGNVSWSIPLGTSLLISVVLTIVLNLILRH